jgi:hypothetical protein
MSMGKNLTPLLDKINEINCTLVFIFLPTADLILLDTDVDPSVIEVNSKLEIFKRISFAKIIDNSEFIGLL